MRLNPSGVMEAVVAAVGVALAWLLLFGVSAAAAKTFWYPANPHPSATAAVSTGAVWGPAVLVAALICAGIAGLALGSRRKGRATMAPVEELPLADEPVQRRKAA
jgi:hypothetical protein